MEGFLYNLFADPDIIRLPGPLSLLQRPIAFLIAKSRAKKSSEGYRSIGGGSPIMKYTREQAALMTEELVQRGFTSAKCYIAMRYWQPYTETALAEMKADGVNAVVVLPLYPQFSISTSGSSLRLLKTLFANDDRFGKAVPHTVVPAWYRRPGYLRTMARLIVKELMQFTPEQMSRVGGQSGLHVLFSAHGVPKSYIAAGDPYERQMKECVALISEEVRSLLRGLHSESVDEKSAAAEESFVQEARSRLSKEQAQRLAGALAADATEPQPVEFHLSFQSRVGPIEWLKPYTEDKLVELGKQRGVKSLVVVPVSFVSEHIETLEEIDMEYRELAEENGIHHWRRAPALNTDPGFVADLADMVQEAVERPIVTVSEAASPENAAVEARSVADQLHAKVCTPVKRFMGLN